MINYLQVCVWSHTSFVMSNPIVLGEVWDNETASVCVNNQVANNRSYEMYFDQIIHSSNFFLINLHSLTHWLWRCRRWGLAPAGRRCSAVRCSRRGSLQTGSSSASPSWTWSRCPPAETAHRYHFCRLVPRGNKQSCHSRAPLRSPSGRRRWRGRCRRLRWSEALPGRRRKGEDQCVMTQGKQKYLQHLSSMVYVALTLVVLRIDCHKIVWKEPQCQRCKWEERVKIKNGD